MMTISIPTTPSTLPVPVPVQHLLLVPLSLLRPSARNVRRSGTIGIAELAASIARVGLLQNLTVTLARDGEHYDVVAGSRRLAALKLLAKQHRITKDAEVACLMVADVSARTASLTENLQREAMHPADQFAAFAALVAEGRTVEEIAADFAVTPLVVQRRLKLANISPRLMADYRAGEIVLDQLMALAITDEHEAQEAQEAAYYNAPAWNRDPQALRARLTEKEIDACRSPLAQFVGLEAYEAAGGGTRRDLFADAHHGIYLSDNALLYRLAQERLDAEAQKVRAQGWAWVDAVPSITSADLHLFQRAPMQAREPRTGEAKRIAALQAKMQRLGAAIEEALEAGDDERADALHEQGERAGEHLQAIEQGLVQYSPATRAVAGAIVTVGNCGEIVIHRGLMREAEAKAMRLLAKAREGTLEPDAEQAEGTTGTTRLSETLTRRLSAHRTAALRVELTRNPHAALATLVCHLLEAHEYRAAHTMPLCISLRPQCELDAYAPDVSESPASAAMQEFHASLTDGLPNDGEARFAHLLGLDQEALLQLLALCVASSLNAVTSHADADSAAPLAKAVALDMAAWWTPTAEGYFRHVPKAAIAADAAEFAPEHAARLATLTKAGSAAEAERLAAGTGWLPAMLRQGESITATA